MSRFQLEDGSGFNPRPGLSTGAICHVLTITDAAGLPCVSIRAPAFRPGRYPTPRAIAARNSACFNPRPGLSTGAMRCPSNGSTDFAPLVSIRAPAFRPGRWSLRDDPASSLPVSIRAPAFRPGRCHPQADRLSDHRFQSAPRPFDRGDFGGVSETGLAKCFNPRPGLSTGAMSLRTPSHPPLAGFNPRPGLSTGAIPRQPPPTGPSSA